MIIPTAVLWWGRLHRKGGEALPDQAKFKAHYHHWELNGISICNLLEQLLKWIEVDDGVYVTCQVDFPPKVVNRDFWRLLSLCL